MKRFLLNFNYIQLICILALVAMGGVFIHSAGEARAAVFHGLWVQHLYTAGAGLIMYFALAATDYRKILDFTALPVFAISLVLLVLVLMVGTDHFGGKRWLWFFQPSEFAKLAVIMATAHFFGSEDGPKWRYTAKGLMAGLAMIGVPALLILREPDLGTSLVLAPSAIVMLLAARVWRRGLVTILILGAVGAGLLIGTIARAETLPKAERDAIYEKLPLKPHQVNRLRTFVNPESDPYGSGWNLKQAKISIGSGSFSGKGVGNGDHKLMGYLPPSVSMNDFIFAVLAEESGFAGSIMMLALFMGLLLACLWTAFNARDDRGRLVAIGVATLIFFHVYENVAMSVGLMPITGLPLPFISAGRTFLVVLMAALGMVQSVNVTSGKNQTAERS